MKVLRYLANIVKDELNTYLFDFISKMIEDSYKSSEIFRNFNDIINEFYEASKKDRKANKKFSPKINNADFLDQQIVDRVFKNLNLLSESNENFHILSSLKSDISMCPLSIKLFIQGNPKPLPNTPIANEEDQNTLQIHENQKSLIEGEFNSNSPFFGNSLQIPENPESLSSEQIITPFSQNSLQIHGNPKSLIDGQEFNSNPPFLENDYQIQEKQTSLDETTASEEVNSISFCFQNALHLKENPKLLLEVIKKIVDINQEYSNYFSTDILDIFHLSTCQDCSELATKLSLQILKLTDDGANNLIDDGFFSEIYQLLTDNMIEKAMQNEIYTLFMNSIRIIKYVTIKCRDDLLKKNKYLLIPFLHTLFFQSKSKYRRKITYSFRMILEKTDCLPSVLLPPQIFTIIMKEFTEKPSVEHLYLFNSILYYDNKEENHEDKDTFFLKYENIFIQLIDILQNPDFLKMTLRLLANFTYVNNYCQFILTNKIYEPLFQIIIKDDLPFKCRDDTYVFFCNLFIFSPPTVASYPQFRQIFIIMTDIIDSIHSKSFTECFIKMIDALDDFIQKSKLNLNINIMQVLINCINSNFPEIAQWAQSKMKSKQK